MNVFIRKLKVEDAEVSWRWRNDPEIWKLSGRKWNNTVTKEIEAAWIEKVMTNVNEVRFAICVEEGHNVQLTNIGQNKAEYHIFIGDKTYWGKGVASLATGLLLDYARKKLQLEKIYLVVHKNNKVTQALYRKHGFKDNSIVDGFINMEIDL